MRNLVLVAACCLIVCWGWAICLPDFFGGQRGHRRRQQHGGPGQPAPGSQESTAAAPGGIRCGHRQQRGAGAEVQEDTAGTTAGSAADGSLSTAEGAPALELSGESYVLTGETSPTLPQGFQPEGTLTEDQAGEAGYAACDYYTSPDQPDRCWVYTSRQQAYLLWTLEEN